MIGDLGCSIVQRKRHQINTIDQHFKICVTLKQLELKM